MKRKENVFASSGSLDTELGAPEYRIGLIAGTIAKAEEVNTFCNMSDKELKIVCDEVANALEEQGIALNPNDSRQLSKLLKEKIGAGGFMQTGIDFATYYAAPTQSGNTISFESLKVYFNNSVYYGTTQADYTVVTVASQNVTVDGTWVNGVHYIYCDTSGAIKHQTEKVKPSEGNAKCLLGSVFVYNSNAQEGTWKFMPWLRSTSQNVRENRIESAEGGVVSAIDTKTLSISEIEVNAEGINFANSTSTANTIRFPSASPMSYKFMYPYYNPLEPAKTELDTTHIYNITNSTWDDISDREGFIVLVPCVTPVGQTLFIAPQSEKSGAVYSQIFPSIESAKAAIVGLQYNLGNLATRCIYLDYSVIVKIGATDLQDGLQFALASGVPQVLLDSTLKKVSASDTISVNHDETLEGAGTPISPLKISSDLRQKIEKRTARNVGDIFYTMRTDEDLNGAVECNGATYNVADYAGEQSIGTLLENGTVASVTMDEYYAQIQSTGVCGSFGYDKGGASFKVPKIQGLYIQSNGSDKIGEHIQAGLPNIKGTFTLSDCFEVGTSGTFYRAATAGSNGNWWDSWDGSHKPTIGLDASRSSSIYGNSSTVTPETVVYRPMVQLYTGATDDASNPSLVLKNQGVENAGKALIVNELGILVPQEIPSVLPPLEGNEGKYLTNNGDSVEWKEIDTYTKAETDSIIDQKIAGVYRVKGSVDTYEDLPTSENVVGDVWNVIDTGANYVWTSDLAWDKLSETIDLSIYLKKTDQITTDQIPDKAVTEAKLALQVQNKIAASIALIPKVNEKADKSDTYTKAEVDQKISDALGTIETALAEV